MCMSQKVNPPTLIFIDVDGVLNTIKTRKLENKDTDPLWDQPDKELMDNFAHIVMACEADVIAHTVLCHALTVLAKGR